jgi:DNA-binding response OmpR family regulator
MITALADRANVVRSGVQGCDRYLLKPINRKQMLDALRKMGLIPSEEDGADE